MSAIRMIHQSILAYRISGWNGEHVSETVTLIIDNQPLLLSRQRILAEVLRIDHESFWPVAQQFSHPRRHICNIFAHAKFGGLDGDSRIRCAGLRRWPSL